MEDRIYMEEALKLAREAFEDGEVPVGCVIVRGEEVVGRGRNRREKDKSALSHAELEAIADACRNLGGWRLWECTLHRFRDSGIFRIKKGSVRHGQTPFLSF